MIGHATYGSGPHRVLVMNDWIGDTSTWDAARPYLDALRFTWVFADLRGYGRSRGQSGAFTVEEAAADVVELADALGYGALSVVGHSMSTLVALHLAQRAAGRVTRAVVITPPPPGGFGVDDERLELLRGVGRGDDAARTPWLRARLGDRLSEGWLEYKRARWRACADPEAVAGYVAMFARRGLPEPARPVEVPLLAVTGERDVEPMQRAAVTRALAPIAPRLTVEAIDDSGHYPMEETPPLLVAKVERFLSATA